MGFRLLDQSFQDFVLLPAGFQPAPLVWFSAIHRLRDSMFDLRPCRITKDPGPGILILH
jgi:hypothetical protein